MGNQNKTKSGKPPILRFQKNVSPVPISSHVEYSAEEHHNLFIPDFSEVRIQVRAGCIPARLPFWQASPPKFSTPKESLQKLQISFDVAFTGGAKSGISLPPGNVP
eukprot:Hpha_TRINITY_DN16730_c3_g2::TRINITY_DN16730_c3_g2_i4::g.79774::m.79774